MDNIEQVIHDYIVKEFLSDKPLQALSYDEPLIEQGVIDSLGIFILIGFIEKHFGIQIQPEDVTLDNFKTVYTIKSLVTEKLSARRTA